MSYLEMFNEAFKKHGDAIANDFKQTQANLQSIGEMMAMFGVSSVVPITKTKLQEIENRRIARINKLQEERKRIDKNKPVDK